MANRERHDAKTAGIIKELRELIQRHAPIWCDPSTLIALLRSAAVESGDFLSLIRHAHKGCKYAHRALCEQAGLYICRDEKLPDDLKAYALGVLIEKYPKERSKGEDGSRDIGRNFFIASLVERTRLRGYDATRNRSRHGKADGPSASYIVCQAASGVKGLKMPSESRVEEIRKDYGDYCDFNFEKILSAFVAERQGKGPRTELLRERPDHSS